MLMPRSANDCKTSVYLRASSREVSVWRDTHPGRVVCGLARFFWRVMNDELGRWQCRQHMALKSSTQNKTRHFCGWDQHENALQSIATLVATEGASSAVARAAQTYHKDNQKAVWSTSECDTSQRQPKSGLVDKRVRWAAPSKRFGHAFICAGEDIAAARMK